jgi:hypothetical protein
MKSTARKVQAARRPAQKEMRTLEGGAIEISFSRNIIYSSSKAGHTD